MNSRERHFLRILRKLGSAEQEQVLAFADFLKSRQPPEPAVAHQEPKMLPAKDGETVVGAIKRLRESYAMLDAKAMLNDTSSLMSRHVMGGDPAEAVIVELEKMFERHYQRYRSAPEDA
ncbi:hypothetical protein [Acidithiobacillus sp.]|jgi:hypothetical protein|uniref:hypothetical protein n=1 Tax=Acidithiobacillus sp. TaxID=1872118 RepID=UPI002606A6F5|nr:hypothetical protein [Acidithiobacillus sp.]